MTPVLVLAIDTSTPQITVGVVEVLSPHEAIAALEAATAAGEPAPDPDRLLAEQVVTDAYGHAEKLLPLVTVALGEAGKTLPDLAAIVVGVGPGPFTGLRVGMATAAALGDARNIPVHPVPSHDALAAAADFDGPLLVVTDARRKEVYASGYTSDGARAFGPVAISPADLPAALADIAPAVVTGPGASLVADALPLLVAPGEGSVSLALVRCAHRPLITGAVPGPLTPLYLRRPDAAEPHAPKPALPQV